MNKKGYTLFEILLVFVVLIVIFFIGIPIVKRAIDFSKYGAFKVSASNVIDAVDYYISNNKFVSIPNEGIDISDLDFTILKNNSFDEGRIVRNTNQTELIYLSQGKYCAKGTKDKLKTSDKGCGALDETKPTSAKVFIKNKTKNDLFLVVSGHDDESKIIKYELSVDGGKFYTNGDEQYNVFKVDNKEHIYKVRVTNEAGLSLVVENIKITPNKDITFNCYEKDSKIISTSKEIVCPNIGEYSYQYSSDELNWSNFKDSFVVDKNGMINIRILEKDKVIATNKMMIQNIDEELNGTIPFLDDNMILITYKDNKPIISSKNNIAWNYSNKIWANAIIVRKNAILDDPLSHSREYYLSDSAIGETIYEKDILAYYVWIPKFKYKLWNITGTDVKEQNIEIEFSKENIQSEKINNNWYTHPAFTYTDNKLGFWVNKYEISINNTANCYLNPSIDQCDKDYFEIYSLPNKKRLNFISLNNAYLLTEKLNEHYNKYGLTGKNNHIITNLEWGAIAYLSHSKYGISKNITDQSTTDNITGVYNLGNNNEFVMAMYKNNDVKNIETKYKDFYSSVTSKGRVIGDATKETEKWYGAESKFVTVSSPIMIRGNKSIFDFNRATVLANENIGFRTVMSIK